jgi:electron transfer flavoprotein beta subunit
MGAKGKPQEVLGLGDLGVDPGSVGEAGSRTTVLELSPPPSRGDSVRLDDESSAPGKIVEFLAEKRLL